MVTSKLYLDEKVLWQSVVHAMVADYRGAIEKWLLIKPGDSVALKKVYSFLIKCQTITADITSNALNTLDTLRRLLAKLSGNIKDTWNRLGCNLRRYQKKDAEFEDLVNFVEEDTFLVTEL